MYHVSRITFYVLASLLSHFRRKVHLRAEMIFIAAIEGLVPNGGTISGCVGETINEKSRCTGLCIEPFRFRAREETHFDGVDRARHWNVVATRQEFVDRFVFQVVVHQLGAKALSQIARLVQNWFVVCQP
jgi:hypothetical protein